MRDPRGVAASRDDLGQGSWCSEVKECSDMKVACGIVHQDLLVIYIIL